MYYLLDIESHGVYRPLTIRLPELGDLVLDREKQGIVPVTTTFQPKEPVTIYARTAALFNGPEIHVDPALVFSVREDLNEKNEKLDDPRRTSQHDQS